MSRTTKPSRQKASRGASQKPDTRASRPNWEAMNEAAPSRRHVGPSRVPIEPKTSAQRAYDAAIRASIIVFGTGPAGTGKTFLAATRAAEAYRDGLINTIVITRPNVEAAEDKLGYLPGELEEKFEPYFRPVREALEKVLGTGTLEYALKRGDIEARPLALMRGATFENAWVICDEMQNATRSQMKLLLSRAGENVKFLVNGDEDQCDLDDASKSGLMDAVERLRGIDGVSTVEFGVADIVRSGICRAVIEAYSSAPAKQRYNESAANDVELDAGLKLTLRVA